MGLWIAAIVAGLVGLYLLHRLALYLEARGYLYYRHRKPTPGGVPPFLPLQSIVEPQVEHLLEAQNHLPEQSSDDDHVPDHP
jgi:hypothetical protein